MMNGQPFPLAPRNILKGTLQSMAGIGAKLIAGVEMEWSSLV